MLEYLARYIQKNGGLKVRFHSVLTAAEGVNAAQRELFKEVFQAPVFASYGCREFMLVAMECEQGQLHLSAENLLVECLHKGQPAEPGQPGEVVVTDLHNYAFPFLRYSLGDVASPSTQSCPCGRGLPLLDAVHGRIPDTIQTPDGRLISGIFFPHLLKEFIWIEQFQVIQKQLDHVLVKLLPTDPNEAARQLPAVETQIRSVLGDAIRIEFEFCAEIPRNATGKHRAVISEIPVKI
jgi:phenylacetate-CoA ligase